MSKNLILGDFQHEIRGTRRMLERVPDEHLGWKPHEKSFTLGELATHLMNLLYWQIGIFQSDELDMAKIPPAREALPNREAILDEFDRHAAKLTEMYFRLLDVPVPGLFGPSADESPA